MNSKMVRVYIDWKSKSRGFWWSQRFCLLPVAKNNVTIENRATVGFSGGHFLSLFSLTSRGDSSSHVDSPKKSTNERRDEFRAKIITDLKWTWILESDWSILKYPRRCISTFKNLKKIKAQREMNLERKIRFRWFEKEGWKEKFDFFLG